MTTSKPLPELKERSAAGSTAQKVVYTGVFTAVYFVTFFAIGMLGFFGPQFMFISAPLAILVNGTVIILMLNKVRSFGALTTLGVIVGILMMFTGHAWTTLAMITATALIADLIAKSGGYRDQNKNIIAYAILQVWYLGAWLPVFYGGDAYYADIARQMGQEYADHMRSLYTPTILIIFTIVNFLIALLGGWIGVKILKRNFQKAGMA